MGREGLRDQEKLQEFLRFNLYRIFLLSLFLLAGYYFATYIIPQEANFLTAFTHYIILSYLLTIIIVLLISYTSISTPIIIHFQFILDILITSYLVYFTGVTESPFTFIYLLIALAISFFFPSWTNIFYGVGMGIIFTLLTYIKQFQENLPLTPPVMMNIFYIFSMILIFNLLGSFLYSRIKKMEQRLISNEKDLFQIKELYKEIVNNVKSGILIVNQEGNILYSNPSGARILGIDPVGKNFENIFHQKIDQEANREELVTEINGRKLIAGMSSSHIRLQDEELYLIVFQDLTRIKEMEEKLLEAEKFAVIGEMASNIAHELRNPLATIRASSELLVEEIANQHTRSERASKIANILISESERIENLVKQILNYSKEITLKMEKINLPELIQRIFLKFHQRFPDVSLTIEGEKDAIIDGDPMWLEEAFSNLIQNSIDAMGDKGKMLVSIRKTGANYTIFFSDSGEGIPREIEDKIFHPFFTTKRNGTGLGLALTRKIINSHGGAIQWDSEKKGFIIILPGEAQ